MGVDIIARGLSAAETARRKRLQVIHALRASMARAALPDAGFGPNLVTNGTFDTDTAWTKGTGVTISGGLLNLAASSGYAEQAIATVPGRTYVVTGLVTGANQVWCGAFDSSGQNGALSATPRSRSGAFQFHFTANDTQSFLGFAGTASGPTTLDHVIAREVLDGHLVLPTIGSNSATSTIATGTLWQVADGGVPLHAGKYTFVGAEWRVAGTTWPLSTMYRPITTRAGDGTNPLANEFGRGRVRFALDASLELYVRCDPLTTNGGFRLKVDGKYVRLGALGIDATVGSLRYIPITWGDGSDLHRKPRHYELEFIQNAWFGGVRVANAYRPSPWPQPDGLRVLIHGDSMVMTVVDTGSRESTPTSGCGFVLADILGQSDTWVSDSGGTGWFAPNPKTRNWFNDRVGIDVVPAAADVIVEMGGLNDSSIAGLDQATVQSAVETWLDAVISAKPETVIFMTGPIAPTTPTAGDLKIAAAKAAAAAKYPRNVAYVDNLTDPWFFGTGRQGTVVGDGNRDWAIGSDTTHPTIEGHRYLAHRLAKGIAAAIPGLIARQG